ncbi:hypothetical protein [Thalassotalea sp. G2M2-11]|uniref:hypothetical protein n=1 Tax=Thalassotalea sp. G2M2-11 TaxID=2787627 RepID=UPI0019D2B093|nr:hypothetical protein [Thalassotalea sp. G2M2-11]
MKIKELSKTISKLQDAKNVTDYFLYRTQKVAKFICEEMQTLGLNELLNGKYFLNEVFACGQSFSLLSLQVSDNDFFEYPVNLMSNEVSSNRKMNFFGGDYNAKYYVPNRHDLLTFINDIPKIFAELADQNVENDIELLDCILEVIDSHQKAA